MWTGLHQTWRNFERSRGAFDHIWVDSIGPFRSWIHPPEWPSLAECGPNDGLNCNY